MKDRCELFLFSMLSSSLPLQSFNEIKTQNGTKSSKSTRGIHLSSFILMLIVNYYLGNAIPIVNPDSVYCEKKRWLISSHPEIIFLSRSHYPNFHDVLFKHMYLAPKTVIKDTEEIQKDTFSFTIHVRAMQSACSYYDKFFYNVQCKRL